MVAPAPPAALNPGAAAAVYYLALKTWCREFIVTGQEDKLPQVGGDDKSVLAGVAVEEDVEAEDGEERKLTLPAVEARAANGSATAISMDRVPSSPTQRHTPQMLNRSAQQQQQQGQQQ